MVFVKVRETYDLHTLTNQMSVISIHTPDSDIIKRNYPGLLMQCKAYRPVSCDVRVACASVMPLDPAGVGLSGEGVVAPEDLFNPILYKACTNFGMSQIEARIAANSLLSSADIEVKGSSVSVDNNSTVPSAVDQFDLYYGFLSDTHSWKHAAPQSGFSMSGLRPLVYELLNVVGDVSQPNPAIGVDRVDQWSAPQLATESYIRHTAATVKGNAKPLPMMNTTWYSVASNNDTVPPGFNTNVNNAEIQVPCPVVTVAGIIVPPSRLHSLYYRMVVEWTLEFSMIRSVNEIATYSGVAAIGDAQHYASYSYPEASKISGVEESSLKNETSMVSTNAEIQKVM